MHGIRRPNTRNNIIALASGFAAFVLVFLFQAILNLKYKTMTSIPGDFQNLFYATKLMGSDWNNLTSPPKLNILPSFVYFLILRFVRRGPIFIWQCLLLVMAVCKSVPAFVATFIAKKRYDVNVVLSILVGVLCSVCIPERSNFLTSQAFAVMFVWLLVLVYVELSNIENRAARISLIIISQILVFCLAITSFDYIVFVPAFLTYFICEFVKKHIKKSDFIVGMASLAAAFAGSVIFTLFIQRVFIPRGYNIYRVAGTIQRFELKLIDEIESLVTPEGWLGLFDSILGSVWELTVYSFGLIPLVVILSVGILWGKKGNKRLGSITNATVIISLGLIFAIIYRTITMSFNFALMHIEHYSPFPSVFEIEDFECYIGPMLLFMVLAIYKKYEFGKKQIIATLTVFFASSLYMFFVLFFPTNKIAGYNLKTCFGDNASLLLCLFSSENIGGIIAFFITILIVVGVAFLAITNSLDYKDFASLFICLFLFQYLFGYYGKDSGYWDEVNMFSKIDDTYGLSQRMGSDFANIDQISFMGDYNTGFILQYAIKDMVVVPGVPDEELDEVVIVSSYDLLKVANFLDVTEYYYCGAREVNPNEFFYVKGNRYLDLFASYGFQLDSAAKEYYMVQNLNRVYKVALGREIDRDGYEYWSEEISEGNVTYKEFIYGVLMGEEFMSKGYSHRDTVNKFYTLFYDPDLTDDEKYEPKYEDLKMLSKQLDEGVPFNLFIEGFFISENCVLDDLRWE
ncbi:MAG: hypothetical protein MJ172_07785 [Clostridia bacterium]|nr:hypothetical protein [Clostridia bacterium]